MKKLILFALLASGTFAFATGSGPQFSAFTSNNQLYVTVLTDSCNAHGPLLDVDASCRSDRWTTNFATICKVDFHLISTMMYCQDQTPVARVFKVDLKKAKVTEEALTLQLNYMGTEISVDINK